MPVELSLSLVIITGLLDAINPCAIGVLVLLLSYFSTIAGFKFKMLMAAISYLAAVYVTYFLIGLGVISLVGIDPGLSLGFYYLIAVISIAFGVINVKDFFWYGKGFSAHIPTDAIEPIKRWAKKATVPSALVLGVFVAIVEFPCTGSVYLAILAMMRGIESSLAIFYLLVYNLMFILPLIVVTAIAFVGIQTGKIEVFRKKARKWMRLFLGVFLIIIGLWMLFGA